MSFPLFQADKPQPDLSTMQTAVAVRHCIIFAGIFIYDLVGFRFCQTSA